jgi:hypothetical protein
MRRRIGMVTLLLTVSAGIGAEMLWRFADRAGSFPSPLGEHAWVVAALAGGLVWLGIEYGRDRRRTFRDQLRQLRKTDQEGS